MVTGFGPFGSILDNPSAEIARALDRPHRILDVTYRAVEQFLDGLNPDQFDGLLLMGVAARRTHLCIELIARNAYGSLPDAEGTERSGPIDPDGPDALKGTLARPKDLTQATAADPNLRLSRDAGTYLCNFAYYRALQTFPAKRIAFLHVPPFSAVPLPDQQHSIDGFLRGFGG